MHFDLGWICKELYGDEGWISSAIFVLVEVRTPFGRNDGL